MAVVKGRIRVGHSPDADDAFMFYAIDRKLVNTYGLTITHVVEDIQSLNERAMRGELEVTAVSVYTFFNVTDRYTLMKCGASIGDNYGPVLVSKTLYYPKEIKGKRVAVPGKNTTAYLTLKLYQPDFEPVFVPFDDVIPAVLYVPPCELPSDLFCPDESQYCILTIHLARLQNQCGCGRPGFLRARVPIALLPRL